MRLLFLSPYFHPAARYGGPIVSTWQLCHGLAASGLEVRVLTSDADGPSRLAVAPGWLPLAPGLAVRYCRRLGGELLAPGMLGLLASEVRRSQVIYVSGFFLWLLPLLLPFAAMARRPLVIAPRGMLLPAALATRRRRKLLFLAAMAAGGGRRAAYHVTSARERDVVAARFPSAHLIEIPNGVEIPQAPPVAAHPAEAPRGVVAAAGLDGADLDGASATDLDGAAETDLDGASATDLDGAAATDLNGAAATDLNGAAATDLDGASAPGRRRRRQPYLLFLGRIHPHKQIEGILEAFASATTDPATPSGTQLWIAGEGEVSYRLGLAARAGELGIAGRVRFLPPVGGPEKAALLAGALGLVLASRSESFGQVVAEALAHGTPAVVTTTAPWQGLATEGCGYWVADRPEALAAGIARLLTLPAEERRAMGLRGRAWMARDFSWEAVAGRMARVLGELVAARGGV